jgi:hypothetical protein
MDTETIVRADPYDVDRRLGELELGRSELWEALDTAHGERRLCTAFDPITLPGNIMWGRLIRRLRETYVRQGWEWGRADQIELVVNSKLQIAVTACSGDQGTGKDALLMSKYVKGPAWHKRVLANNPVIPGMEAYAPAEPQDKTYAGFPTWCLLYYFESVKDDEGEHTRLWAELSLPTQVGEHGKIAGWKERNFLGFKDYPEPYVPEINEDDPAAPFTEIDVPIERLS